MRRGSMRTQPAPGVRFRESEISRVKLELHERRCRRGSFASIAPVIRSDHLSSL
jgi:hypothetical protein